MSDPRQPRQPTQEELEAHLEQLRRADVAEVLVQAVNMLATGAQVKLGRPDARVLIDAIGAVADASDGRADANLVKQIRDAVTQLQMAQVQAERESAGEERPAGEPAQEQTSGPSARSEASAQQESAGKRMTDRLWIPGREPGGG